MLFSFYLKFKSFFGQSVVLALREVWDSGQSPLVFVDLHYLNEECWHADYRHMSMNENSKLVYHYILKENGREINDLWLDREVDCVGERVVVHDDWQMLPVEDVVFNSRAFAKVLLKDKVMFKGYYCEKPSHTITVRTTRLGKGKSICLLGSSSSLGKWNPENAILLSGGDGWWKLNINLAKDEFPLEYKFAVYNTATKKIEDFENSSNRKLGEIPQKETITKLNLFADFSKRAWKGAGVNVQLSSLKTDNSWGVGDFSDLNKLTEWSSACGIKMIQLLPINDTTATYTRADSYPYSAVSAFALHPLFLDVSQIADAYGIKIPRHFLALAEELNACPALEYEKVCRLKQESTRFVFDTAIESFLKESAFDVFFNENRHWLVPYAAFCFLRDQYQTADYSHWENYAQYDDKLVQQLVEVNSPAYKEIAFHYFIQYHLHLQLSAAVEYAHQLGIIMKGDLPIGVGRYSMDTWMSPSLFHLNMQAGAPPDAFAVKGQNWSFPTYNWDSMKATNYSWWRQRLTHMSNYFDATRIDHVLGFFRIWSVPMHAVEGIFGVFVPANPFGAAEFTNAGLHFDEQRYCTPFFNDVMLHQLFGEKTSWVKENFFNGNIFKEEFNTQRKIEDYSKSSGLDAQIKQKLFDLLADVILFKDDKKEGCYHFRISVHDTYSYKNFSHDEQEKLNRLYVRYFYECQNDLWYQVAQQKLDAIQQSSDMMICAEDLGMVPDMVEGVLKSREMLALQVQRMPKQSYQQFSHPIDAPYLSVVTPSTHDMSTIRDWWEEDAGVTQNFYNNLLSHTGKAPQFCEPEICREIIRQHLNSHAMWSVFLIQDLMSFDEKIRRNNPGEERINNPADPNHYWNYRLHVTIESLIENAEFNHQLRQMITESDRC